MSDKLSTAFDRLRSSSQKLNSLTDIAGQMVRDVEAFLEEFGVGLHGCVLVKTIAGDTDNPSETNVWLEYLRLNGKYRIVVVQANEDGASLGEDFVRPWSECSREDKIESFEKLPELLLKLAETIEEQAAKAEQVLSLVAPQLPPKKKKGGA